MMLICISVVCNIAVIRYGIKYSKCNFRIIVVHIVCIMHDLSFSLVACFRCSYWNARRKLKYMNI
jgi:hypothetical protein